MAFGGKGKGRINFIIKDHVIRYLDGNKTDLTSVRAVGEKYLPEGIIVEGKIRDRDQLHQILEECVSKWGLKNREVQFIVPDSVVVVRNLQIPKEIHRSELKGYLYMELGTSIHLPIENPIFDAEVVGLQGDQQEVLLFAAPESLISSYSSLLEEVKLIPVAADISPLSLYRLYFSYYQPTTNDHTLCIQFDIQAVNVSIFREHKLLLMRHLPMESDTKMWKIVKDGIGNETLLWSGSEDHMASQIQDIMVEIERVIDYYRFNLTQGSGDITRIFLTGDHPQLVDIFRSLNDLSEVNVDFFEDYEFTTQRKLTITPRHYLSLGLSLKEVKS